MPLLRTSSDFETARLPNGSVPSSPVPSTSPSIPLAIVGLACRLPGDVCTPHELWELCSRARSGWSEIPQKRFNAAPYYHPNPSKKGCLSPQGGYFLQQDVSVFDAPFFNITAQEATSLDPQQRLSLECAFEALENSGIPKEAIIGHNVGVFAGGSFADYEVHGLRDIETVPNFTSTGNAAALLSNRISYYFDLRGPSFTLDTACSSSLTALHQAAQSLRCGESKVAIVSGSHMNLSPDYFITMSTSQLFNPTGKTFSFDHRGDSGFARGEGAGCIVLKPLDDALKDNDQIRAVIRATGINQDGKTAGITVPNGLAQEDLIRRVYSSANINPSDCGFVEAHGTGTKVGDPIEAKALHHAFGEGRNARNPLYIGSVKSNVGHLEGASGIVAVIKAALILERNLILPNTNYEKPNENIPFREWNMKVPTSVRPWPRGKKYVSINNFGFGGGNAHAVLERAPASGKPTLNPANGDGAEPGASDLNQQPWRLFVISANDSDSIRSRAKDLTIYLEQRPQVFEKHLGDNLAYTLGQRRSHLAWKLAVPARSSDELGSTLAAGKWKPIRAVNQPNIGMVFTGQGAQWNAMGRELFQSHTVFASSMVACDRYLKQIGSEFSLIDELAKDAETSRVDSAEISQPACTALQISLTNLLDSWGILPVAVIGHSSGEIGAAYAAGMLSMESSMSLAYFRGRCSVSLKQNFPQLNGAMLAVADSPEAVRPVLKVLENGYAVVACINSPSSVTVSGDVDAIDELSSILETRNVWNRKLRTGVAYHSNHMKCIAEEYMTAVANIRPLLAPRATFYSSLHGRVVDVTELHAAYWVENLTSPVEFCKGVESMCGDADSTVPSPSAKVNMLVEIGPHSALEGPVKQILKGLGPQATKIPFTPSLVRKKDAVESMLNTAAFFFMRGCHLDFKAINFPHAGSSPAALLTDLPRYPWQHSNSYWHHSRICDNHLSRRFPRNDILGTLADYSNSLEPTWRNILRLDDLPWLRQHRMQSMNVCPLAFYVVMSMEAASQRAQMRHVPFNFFDVREVISNRALILEEGNEVEVALSLKPFSEGTRMDSDIWDEFRICSWTSQKGWVEHCRGLIAVRHTNCNAVDGERRKIDEQIALKKNATAIMEASTEQVDLSQMYSTLHDVGAGYGEMFRCMESSKACDSCAYAEVVVPNTKATLPHEFEPELIVHPAFFDHITQIVWPIFGAGRQGLDLLYMPSSIKRMSISKNLAKVPGDRLRTYGSGKPNSKAPKPTKFEIFATSVDDISGPLLSLEEVVLTPIRESTYSASHVPRELCFKLGWEPVSNQERSKDPTNIPEAMPNGIDKENQTQVNGEMKSNGKPKVNGEVTVDVETQVNGHRTPESEKSQTFNEIVVIIHRRSDDKSFLVDLANRLRDVIGKDVETATLDSIDPTGKICIFVSEIDGKILTNMNDFVFSQIQSVLTNASGLLWILEGAYKDSVSPDANMVVGLARSIRSETMQKFVTLDLDASDGQGLPSKTREVVEVFQRTWLPQNELVEVEMEYVEKAHELFVPRIYPDDQMNLFVQREIQEVMPYEQPFCQPGRPLKLEIGSAGALDTLRLVDDNKVSSPLGDFEVEIEVKATGMNFKDIVISMGQLSSDYIGVECSGIISRVGKNVSSVIPGQSVMAMSEGAYANYTRCAETSVTSIPQDMSFEDASTIPVVFCTAYYGLMDLGRLGPGDSVLIHAAAGGVGQASILLAKMVGADIFATVGSQIKKEFLIQEYAIPSDRIYYSRDASFGPAIRRATGGHGVDVVINSLAGDILRETWDCLAHFGRFIEIGKRDITSNTRLEMARFDFNATFSSVDLTVVANERPRLMKRIMSDVIKLLTDKSIRPISPISVYRISEIESAFRTLQSGKSMGKLVIVGDTHDQVKATAPKHSANLLLPNATYIIIGGTGGLGRSMATWMSNKGAGNIILVSRSGKVEGKTAELVQNLEANGTHVRVLSCDASSTGQVDQLIKEDMKDLPPVRGIIHGAMVLHDVLFEKMTYADFTAVVNAKVPSAWNFHHALSSSPLDFFIMLSSAAGAIGNRGQAAYAAANCFLNAFVQYRISNGLPASSIDLTAVSDVGYLAEVSSARQAEVTQNLGGETLNEEEVLALLKVAITGEMKTTCNNHCMTGLRIDPSAVGSLFWAGDAKFAHLRAAAEEQNAATGGAGGDAAANRPLSVRLETAPSFDEALKTLYDALITKLSAVLMIPAEEMEPGSQVSAYGVDSLVAIEIRNWITREAEANLQVLELLTSANLMSLAETVLIKSKLKIPKKAAQDQGDGGDEGRDGR